MVPEDVGLAVAAEVVAAPAGRRPPATIEKLASDRSSASQDPPTQLHTLTFQEEPMAFGIVQLYEVAVREIPVAIVVVVEPLV